MKEIIICAGLFIFSGLLYGNEQKALTAEEIIKEMSVRLNPQTSKAKVKMTIMTTTQKKRIFIYKLFSKDHGEKSLLKYISPSRIKGQTILMLNDARDIWVYFPRTKRIRKLASHARRQKLKGSDFSYEDLGASNAFVDEYNAVRKDDEKKEGRQCYKLELTRKVKSSAGYSRLMLWVDKEYLIPLVIDYYQDENPGILEKELILSNIKLIDGIYTPMKFVMYNKLDNTKTVMEFTEVSYNLKISDDLFTELGMQK